ncbi:MAG: mannose-1-phosphate guanylyltransferase/mannose-6-phosphate isomerase, partial [Micavibrio aeruginosavorus]
MNDFSLLQNTMRRALRTSGADASTLVTVTLGALKNGVAAQLAEIDEKATQHILCEPSARNTAAAVAFAAEYVLRVFGEGAIMWILPADHHIEREDVLANSFQHALAAAKTGKLVTFGINPTRPDTGYGYIRVGEADASGKVHSVQQFVEKPDLTTAKSYLQTGEHLWNSGMFLFSAKSVVDHFATLSPKILKDVRRAMEVAVLHPCTDIYNAIESQPFDKAIMEKSDQVAVVPCNPEWSDIGSWESLWDIRAKDSNNNVIEGRAACHNAKGCLIQSKDKLIAVAGIDNLVVVETEDALLITNKSDNDSMKAMVTGLKKAGAPEVSGFGNIAPQAS